MMTSPLDFAFAQDCFIYPDFLYFCIDFKIFFYFFEEVLFLITLNLYLETTCNIYWLMHIEPSLNLWQKLNLVVASALSDGFLSSN